MVFLSKRQTVKRRMYQWRLPKSFYLEGRVYLLPWWLPCLQAFLLEFLFPTTCDDPRGSGQWSQCGRPKNGKQTQISWCVLYSNSKIFKPQDAHLTSCLTLNVHVNLRMFRIRNGIWNREARPFEIRTNGCIFFLIIWNLNKSIWILNGLILKWSEP